MPIIIKNEGIQEVKYQTSGEHGTIPGNSEVTLSDAEAGQVAPLTLSVQPAKNTTYTLNERSNA